MNRLGYGVIGLGFFGEKHAEVAASWPTMDLRAVCTRRPARLREIQKRFNVSRTYTDYNDLLADPDIHAVSIVTHVDDHVAPTVAALRAGKHVLLEKPMARTVTECDQILAAAAKAAQSGTIFMVGHICRFNPRYALARERIQAGELGRIVSMYARRNIPAARSKSVLEKIDPLLGDGVHDTDLMLWMTGLSIDTAYALTTSVRRLPHPDLGWAMYRFSNGAIGVIENVWFLPDNTPFRIHEQMEIIGTDGAIYVHGGDMNLVIHGKSGPDCPDTLYWPEVHGQIMGALRDEMAYFAGCALAGRQPTVVTPAEARSAVAVVSAAVKSAASGRVVRIPHAR